MTPNKMDARKKPTPGTFHFVERGLLEVMGGCGLMLPSEAPHEACSTGTKLFFRNQVSRNTNIYIWTFLMDPAHPPAPTGTPPGTFNVFMHPKDAQALFFFLVFQHRFLTFASRQSGSQKSATSLTLPSQLSFTAHLEVRSTRVYTEYLKVFLCAFCCELWCSYLIQCDWVRVSTYRACYSRRNFYARLTA